MVGSAAWYCSLPAHLNYILHVNERKQWQPMGQKRQKGSVLAKCQAPHPWVAKNRLAGDGMLRWWNFLCVVSECKHTMVHCQLPSANIILPAASFPHDDINNHWELGLPSMVQRLRWGELYSSHITDLCGDHLISWAQTDLSMCYPEFMAIEKYYNRELSWGPLKHQQSAHKGCSLSSFWLMGVFLGCLTPVNLTPQGGTQLGTSTSQFA